MKYANLTSPEIARIAPDAVAVLPLAAIEQHGGHLPVCTDTSLVSELGRRAEAALPDTVALLPTLWPGCSHHHLGFKGTLSISSETYIRVLCDLCECLISDGFTKIFLLNGHGGNHIPFCEAIYRLGLKHRDVWITGQSYWNLAAKELAEQDFMQTPRLTHACEYETSMMMALDEKLVKLAKAEGHRCARESQFYDPLSYTPSRVVTMEAFDQMTPSGAMGSPELSTPQKGRRLFDLITPLLVDFLHEFSQWKPKTNASYD
jgi:creatinine amidohydrolase